MTDPAVTNGDSVFRYKLKENDIFPINEQIYDAEIMALEAVAREKDGQFRQSKEYLFVKHIENHLKEMNIKSHDGKVICKICSLDIDKIKELEAGR